MPGTDLDGAQILVTRPAHQAAPMIRAIEAAGGSVLAFPTLEIRPIADPDPVIEQLRNEHYDWLIFISRNAVVHGIPLLQQSGVLLDSFKVAAVGNATAQALNESGIKSLSPADNFNSEALADLLALQSVSGRRILILRGNEGREWLRETLIARGAQVDYAECYQRQCPQADPKPVIAACRDGTLRVVTSTSNQGLKNLLVMLPETECIRNLPLLVVGKRQAEAAHTLNWRGKVLLAKDPRPETLVASLSAQRDNW